MNNDFRSYNVIYILYDRKNENHWSLLIIRYSLLGIQTPVKILAVRVLSDLKISLSVWVFKSW